jgi:hypothetical protein
MSAVRDAWALRSMALRAAVEGRYYDARRLWNLAESTWSGELFRYVASRVNKDGSVDTWTVETSHPESWIDLDPYIDWPASASFSSRAAFDSWRLCTGTRILGERLDDHRMPGRTLWVQLSEEQEALCTDPVALLEALVGRCGSEGVGSSWAPLRDAAKFLQEEGA